MTTTTDEQREAQRAAQRKYYASPKGKAKKRKVNASPKAKAAISARRAKLKKAAVEHLGGICVQCGTTERLDFDHIDPSDKSYWISQGYIYAWATLVKELDKCQLLCVPCHAKKTREDRIGVES